MFPQTYVFEINYKIRLLWNIPSLCYPFRKRDKDKYYDVLLINRLYAVESIHFKKKRQITQIHRILNCHCAFLRDTRDPGCWEFFIKSSFRESFPNTSREPRLRCYLTHNWAKGRGKNGFINTRSFSCQI